MIELLDERALIDSKIISKWSFPVDETLISDIIKSTINSVSISDIKKSILEFNNYKRYDVLDLYGVYMGDVYIKDGIYDNVPSINYEDLCKLTGENIYYMSAFSIKSKIPKTPYYDIVDIDKNKELMSKLLVYDKYINDDIDLLKSIFRIIDPYLLIDELTLKSSMGIYLYNKNIVYDIYFDNKDPKNKSMTYLKDLIIRLKTNYDIVNLDGPVLFIKKGYDKTIFIEHKYKYLKELISSKIDNKVT